MVNRHNYEEYFMMYTDDALNVQERHAVEEFLRKNPDLNEELEQFRSIKVTPDEDLVFADKSILYKTEENKRSVPLFKWWYAAAVVAAIITGIFIINRQPSKPGITIIAKVADSNITAENPTPSIAGNETGEKAVDRKTDAMISKTTTADTPSDNSSISKKGAGNSLKHNTDIPVHKVQNNKQVQEEEYSTAITAKNIPDRLSASSMANIIPENTTTIKVAAVMPDKPGAEIIHAVAANTTETVEAAAPENYIQSRKSMLKGLLRKASGIIDKTIEQTTELRNTQQVNIRMGKIEVALH